MIFLVAHNTLKLRLFPTFVSQMAGQVSFMFVVLVAVGTIISAFWQT